MNMENEGVAYLSMEIKDNLLSELQVQSWSLRNEEGLGVEMSLRRWGLWSGKGVRMAECGSGSEISSGWWAAPGRLNVVEASRWILRVIDILGELFDSLDTYHHPVVGQILTITNAPCFLTCRSLWKESRGAKWIRGTLNALSLLWRLWIDERTTNLFGPLRIFWN